MGHQIKTTQYVIVGTLAVFILISSPTLSWAVEANQQTWFNNVTDSLATVGRDPADQKDIRRLRQESRRQYRLQKEALRKKSHTRKTIRKQQDAVKRKYQGTGHTGIGL